VAALHTEILRQKTFAELDRVLPGRISNKTNGITPRRWLLQSNPGLAVLITDAIGSGWVRDLDELRKLTPLAEDRTFRAEWSAMKRVNKAVLADRAMKLHGIDLDPDSMFDCQVKRFHEYKRQNLNALHAIALHEQLRASPKDFVPRTVIFAGKAAPGYAMAKLSIELIHAVAKRIAGDPITRGKLAVAFLPNYSVSLAEIIFPACDLSEQISTAGTEASGTGNMKAALNGALTIGTLDGANVEIREEVGASNIFIFGHTKDEIEGLRAGGYRPEAFISRCDELRQVVDIVANGSLDGGSGLFRPVVDALTGEDQYFLCADFASYAECQRRAAAVYARPDEWWRMSILNVAGMGKFSSDRTTRQYADEIWGARPVPVSLEGPERD
jgi:starch phosphorylase